MEELYKKLLELNSLLKAVKPTNPQPVGFHLPKIPAIRAPASPSMSAPGAAKDGKIPGMAPAGKKDPKKIAEQIKSGEMSTKTQKVMLKAHENGQWYLDEVEKASFRKPKDGDSKPLRFPDKPADHPYNKVKDEAIIPFDPKHVDLSKPPAKKKLDQ